MKSCKADRPSR